MKAVFVIRRGALVEGIDARCTLRCGAGAGLRMLLDLDLRLIVIEGALVSHRHSQDGRIPHGHSDDGGCDNISHGDPGTACPDLSGGRTAWPAPEATESGQRSSAGNHLSARLSGRLPDNGRRRRRGDPPAAIPGATRHEINDEDAKTAAALSMHYALPETLSGRWRRLDADATDDDFRVPARWPDSPDGSAASDDIAVPEDGVDHFNIADAMLAREERFGALGAGHAQRIGIRPHPTHTRDGAPLIARAPAGCDDAFAGRRPGTRPPGDGLQIIDRLGDLLFREQLSLTAYYCCTHDDSPGREADQAPACFCLPPQPGLLLQAAYEHGIDLQASWMIGATLDDVAAGNRAGCRTILIDNGTETTWRLGRARVPTRIAPDLHGAALLIDDEGERMRRW